MNKKGLLGQIQSVYIIHTIFQYIKVDNFKLKLIFYSKYFQKKLQIGLDEYQEIHLRKNNINLSDYLVLEGDSLYNYFINNYYEDESIALSKINCYKNKQILIFPLNIIDINSNEKLILNYFNKYIRGIKDIYNDGYMEEYEFPEGVIDIYSPYFNILSKNEIFEDFSICIPINEILKLKLKDDYVSVFDELNKSKSKYSSLTLIVRDTKNLIDIKQFNIIFNQIKRLTIKYCFNAEQKRCNDSYDFNDINDTDNVLNLDFKFFLNVENNLVYLNLNNLYLKTELIELDNFINIENFKNLEQLVLNGFHFKQNYKIKSYNLKILKLENCDNIILDAEIGGKLKEFYLLNHFSPIVENKNVLLKLPNLEKLGTSYSHNLTYYYSFIDFDYSKNFKCIKIELSSPINDETKIIQDLCSIKTLESIDISLKNIIYGNIINTTVKHLNINYINIYCILYNFQSLFPNLIDLKLNTDLFLSLSKKAIVEITQNNNLKIKKIILNINGIKTIKLLCGPYELLNTLDIECKKEIINLHNSFPIFSDKCPILNNLMHFRLVTSLICHNHLNNLYNNLDNMPNLKYFELYCITKDIIDYLYKKYIKKLLSLKLDELYLSIKFKPLKERKKKIKEDNSDDSEGEENIEYEENDSNSAESENDGNDCENESKKKKKENDEYSQNELKEISPSFNVNNYRKICIRKLYKNNYEEKNNYKIQHFFKTIN